MREFSFILLIFFASCTRTEKGIVFGTPSYEKRTVQVDSSDLKILLLTKEILSLEESWQHDSSQVCNSNKKYTLYCALQKGSIEALGTFNHRRSALQHVRFAIDDYYRNRWEVHRLADFNNHRLTTFKDIHKVIDIAKETIQDKLNNYKKE